jgi:hypothetical protein
VLFVTSHCVLGSTRWVILTTRHKMPGTKGTRYPNPEIPVPGMPGMSILGLG